MVKVLPKTGSKNLPTNVLTPFSLHKRSLTYRKLPEQLLRLSVLKLDGSSFSFHVARNATVARLKLAIEEEFRLSPKDERKTLWYELHFLQHLRIDLAPAPQHSKNQIVESKQCSVRNSRDARADDHGVTIEDQYLDLKQFNCGQDLDFLVPKSKLRHSLKELLSCSNFGHSKRKALEGKNYP